MSPFSVHEVDERMLLRLEQRITQLGVKTEPLNAKYLQENGLTMYQDWIATFEGNVRVIMWGTHPASRLECDASLRLTVGSPDGKRGLQKLALVKQVLFELEESKV